MKANQPDTNKQIAENLLEMIERLPVGFAHHEIICDSNGKPIDYRFLNVNSKFEFFTGLKASDLIGKTVLEVLPNTEQYWIDYYGKVALTQEPVEFENYSQELNKYYSVYAFSPKKGEFIVLFVDITNTKLVEENLKANQEKLNTIFDFAPVAIITLYNHRINYCNKVFLETYKYTDYQEIYDLTIDDIFDKKTHTLITQENQKSLTIEKYSNTIIGTGIRKDKTEFPVAINTILIKLKNTLLNILYIQDITEQKNLETTLRYQAEELSAQYEELQATTQELEATNQELEYNHRLLQDINLQLKEREEQLNIALEGAELGFWIYDIDSGLLTCNLILYRILGYQPNEIEFNIYSLRDHIYQSDLKKFDQIWLLVAAGKKHHINLKLRFYNKFGDLKWLYIKARVIENNANGLPSKIAGIVYDITQEKLLHDKLQESEYKYRTIFNATHAYMFLIDANTLEIIDVNNSALIAYGYTLYELIGKNINILCAKSDDCVIKNAIDKKQNYIEFTVSYTKNKNPIEVEIELESLFIKQKKYYICSLYNISERLAAEKKIYQSEEQYRSLVNKLPVGVYRTTIDGKLLFGNQALLKILEIDNSVDLSSINTADFYLDKQKRTKEIFKILSVPLNKECVYNYELQLKTAKGNIIWVRDTSKAIFDENDNFLYFEGIIENITESKNYNLYLEKNLKLHELVAEIATEFINITPEKTDTLIEKTLAKLGLFANAEYSILYLLNEQLISSKAVYEWLENPEELWFQEIKTASLSMFPTYEEKLKFGETVIINSIDEIDASETEKQLLLQKGFKAFIIAPIIVNNELSGILGLIGIKEPKLQWSINDKQILQLVAPILLSALQHKKEQLARIESEQRFKSVFDNTGDAMILLGETIEDCNQAALELFQCQREDIIGKTPFDFSPEIQPDGQKSIDKGLMLIELAKQNQASPFYWQHTTLSGQPIDTEVSLSKINYQEKELLHASIRDITLKKQEENNRILIAKLQSLGTLAGGLAHDFNNLLTAIFGNIQLALLENDIEKIKKYLAINDPILERAKGLTQQLLTFSKGGEPKREVVSVKEVIEKNVKFFLSGSRVGLEIDIPDNLWYSYIDKDQIGQVLQNLISNAREAMNDVGTIIITAENYIEKDQKYVRIRLSDTGPGIPQDIMLRIFDPYFTTKPTGTGLGLSISRSIITRHDGQISVESLPNKGTTFTITLPATEPVGSAEHSKTKNLPQLTKKYLKLLILDDEQIILTLLTRMLEKLGHQVTSTTDGRQTIEIYRQAWEAGSPFDIVILDITVPGGLGGKETIQELLKIDPNVKAIVSSGYSDDPVIAKYQEYGFKAALSKPYRLNELNQIINSLI